MPNLAIIPLMGADGVSVIDSALVAEIINLCKTCMGLFTEFPLNVILIAGLCGVGFGIFRGAKHAVRG